MNDESRHRTDLPSHDAPAEEWIRAGLAVVSQKGAGVDLQDLSFHAAQAKGFLYLTGEGAQRLDRKAMISPGPARLRTP